MPYTIRLPDGRLVENIPDEVTPQQAKAKIIAAGIYKEKPAEESFSGLRQIADVPLGLFKGAAQGVRMVADFFGAGSSTSNNIKSVENYLNGLMSAQAKNDQAEIARIMKEAEDKGVADQVLAGVKAFTVAPVDLLAQGLGTAAPAIIGALGAKLLGAGALVTTGVSALTGATMGAGTVKGSIYEETKDALKKAGATEEVAEAKAQEAQAYGGKNLDQILLGTVLGAGASVGPVEKGAAGVLARRILGKAAAKDAAEVTKGAAAGQVAKGALRRRAEAGALEAVPEFLQAGQEQLAQNIALQREGIDTPTMRGVVGAGVLEGLAGAGLGAALGGGAPQANIPAPAPAPAPEEAPPAPVIPPEGTQDVREAISEPSGESFEIGERGLAPVADTGRPEGVEPSGVAPAQPDVGQVVGGEGQPAPALSARKDYRGPNPSAPEDTSSWQDTSGAIHYDTDAQLPSGKYQITEVVDREQAQQIALILKDNKGEKDRILSVMFNQKGVPYWQIGDATEETIKASIGDNLYNAIGSSPITNSQEYGALVQRVRSAVEDLKTAPAPAPTPPAPAPTAPVTPPVTAPAPAPVTPPAPAPTPPAPAPGPKIVGKQEDEFSDEELAFLEDMFAPKTTLKAATGPVEDKSSALKRLEAVGKSLGVERKEGESDRDFSGRVFAAVRLRNALREKDIGLVEPSLLAEQDVEEGAAFQLKDIYVGNKLVASAAQQRDMYEETRKAFNEENKLSEKDGLPGYYKLTDADKRVYFQDNIGDNSQEDHDKASKALYEYLQEKRQARQSAIRKEGKKSRDVGVTEEEEKQGKKAAAAKAEAEIAAKRLYERDRDATGKVGSINYVFPGWNNLSDESRRLFESIATDDNAAKIQTAFRVVKNQIRTELADKQATDTLMDEASYALAQGRIEAERSTKGEAKGRGETLPRDLVDALLSNRPVEVNGVLKTPTEAVLDYLSSNARGLRVTEFGFYGEVLKTFKRKGKDGKVREFKKYVEGKKVGIRNSVARELYRNLSAVLSSIPDFSVKYVFDPNLSPETIAEFDAATNTVYFKSLNLDETTLLHELVHAATVRIINQYFTDKSKLSKQAQESVEHLVRIYDAAGKKITDKKYSRAFENIYEFVAYAMTDPDFQYELQRIQIGSLARATKEDVAFPEGIEEERESSVVYGDALEKTLWNYFTDALAYMYKLFKPYNEREVLFVTEFTDIVRANKKLVKTKKEQRAEQRAEDEEEASYERISDAGASGFVKTKKKKKSDEETKDTWDALQEDIDESKALETEETAESVNDLARRFNSLDGNFVAQRGVYQLRKGILREPGYRGNLLIETSVIFGDLLSAPSPEGITNLAGTDIVGSRLAASVPPLSEDDEAKKEKFQKQVEVKEVSPVRTIKNLFTTKPGWEWIITKAVNDRYLLRKLTNQAESFKMLERFGEKVNDVYGQITRSTGIATDVFMRKMADPTEKVQKAVEKYAEAAGVEVKEALEQLHLILEARHEPERRVVKFMKDVRLDKDDAVIGFDGQMYSADGFREEILKRLINPPAGLSDAQLRDRAKRYRKYLNQVIFETDANGDVVMDADGLPRVKDRFINKLLDTKDAEQNKRLFDVERDIRSEKYSVIAGRNPEEIQEIKRLFERPELMSEIDAVAKAMQEVHKGTIALNREARHFSNPVLSLVDFYGFENYVPFKGKPGVVGSKSISEEFNLETGIASELQEGQDPFGGRKSESENSILQSLADGATAALRVGRKDLTLAIKNAVGDKILDGDPPKRISFEDRYFKRVDMKEIGGPRKIFHYNTDGSIDVVTIKDGRQAEAIRRSYRAANPLWDYVNGLTSFIGQTHTRFNVAFAPMDFVRNSLTNAFTLGAEFGPKKAGQLLTAISADVASGGMNKVGKYMYLYETKNFKKIKELAGGDKAYDTLTADEKFYRDIEDYVESGGKVSYLAGIAAKGALANLIKEVGESGIVTKSRQVGKFFDIYNELFELSNRVSTYRMLKDEFAVNASKYDIKGEEDAKLKAVEYTKNLANFEQVGQYGKQLGSLFMFFRPAATGALRAAESLAPAFGFNEKQFREIYKDKRTPEQIDAAVEKMKEQQKSARYMAVSLVGAGMGVYMMALMMSDDDEQKRNRVATDDMARWTRYARFPIPGSDKFIQIPWGFGLGSFASAGAQLAALTTGRVSLKDTFANLIDIGTDSFVPLPISRISATQNPAAKLVDTMTPSLIRPFTEYVMNLDGLGREIYNSRQSRYGDAYTGGDNIPEIYKAITRGTFDITTGEFDISPNTLYFFANNYADGIAKLISTGYNWNLYLAGSKDFDAKTEVLPIAAYLGTRSNIDAREFSEMEETIKDYERKLNSIKKSRPDLYDRYVEKNPSHEYLVGFYNHSVNGQLRAAREHANRVRADATLTPRERMAELEVMRNVQNGIKREILETYKDILKETK